MPHSMVQKVNDYALRALRDIADRDYILARMAYRAVLFPQFQWSSLHALEKYFKCILLLTRVQKPKIKIMHEIKRSLELLDSRFEVRLSKQSKDFINRLEQFGARFRYLEVSWSISRCELAILDRAVWELRRYCNANLYNYSGNDFDSINTGAFEMIKSIEKPTRQNTHVSNGYLEKILENRRSDTRPSLIWKNLYYSQSKRNKVAMQTRIMAENSPFYLYPDIIDEVSKYIIIPKEIISAYKTNKTD